VLQDVFVRAYGALRADDRRVHVRAWLYRVAHNRCIDHLRRPVPPAADVFEVSRKPLHDPIEEAQRREDLAQLVQDVGRLPEHQRSALLMREIDGMSYAELAGTLDVTVPAVKSLLVRARIGLVEAAQARDADCAEIRRDLAESYDRGVKASGHARRHMRTCDGCREFRSGLRGIRRSFAALNPLGAGPLAVAGAKLLGFGGAGGGAAAGGSAAAGGGAAAAGGVAACKVAAVVCTAALATGGAVEVRHLTREKRDGPARAARTAVAPATAAAASRPVAKPLTGYAPSAAPVPERKAERTATKRRKRERTEAAITAPPPTAQTGEEAPAAVPNVSGGTQAPPPAGEEPVAQSPPPTSGAPAAPAQPAEPAAPPADPATPPAEPGTGTTPIEH
jgi:RNA polymerase sigma factor (sigma-70 family)